MRKSMILDVWELRQITKNIKYILILTGKNSCTNYSFNKSFKLFQNVKNAINQLNKNNNTIYFNNMLPNK